MKKVIDVFDKIDSFLFFIAQIAVLIMMLLTTADAVMRYIFSKSITGAYFFTEKYLMVIVVFLSMSYVMKMKGHIRIDLFIQYLPKRLVKVMDIIYTLLAAVLMFVIAYQAMFMTEEAFVNHYVATGLIPWPIWLSWIWVPIGAYMFTLRLLLIAFQSLLNFNTTDENNGQNHISVKNE
ncbi:TRAP transporter small permease [Cytobacillus depressus]|uniref:TRAP transporter small permease n=1 Tax=Cytobacillus depressus TaxID=1602942 RepID=A0A6L3V7B2_9BACI|nr:TRAP transporter small permease [Cytobacillus depressus]KAB2336216.1 TRAP transporter small permease [Cytobacillus depressus]